MGDNFYTVGVIAGTHGLRGEVKVLPRTDFETERFRAGSVLHLRHAGERPSREVIVHTARRHKQFWLVAFTGLGSIDDVESWRGLELCVADSQLAALPEGTYYFHQLVGLRVVSETGEEIGVLTEVLTPGANDVYVVRPSGAQNRAGKTAGSHGKKRGDILIPAIPDCILGVDLVAGVMTIRVLPGLIDDETDVSDERRGGASHQSLADGQTLPDAGGPDEV
ncbi:ribosome maturation factor RimM [Alicyclobacillus sp. ALC3]|uniref:ribosome maturation factor RimM n=1 Tax=Alicyclobacillus sp. ALC3 TaxID=2796143 RepID=UPI00237867DD|nr:ribosome maturation factor RimM [Alicyclobacillus sp. ALC3]